MKRYWDKLKKSVLNNTDFPMVNHSHLLNSLNNEQKQAVTSTEGYIRVVAGAGSGKTKALAHRFAYLVEEAGIAPNKILSVTFTNKAANVMKKRIRSLIGDKDAAYIKTFHGFCSVVLREDINHLNYPRNFTILDPIDQKMILSEIYEDLGLTVRNLTYKAALSLIADYKDKLNYVGYTTSPSFDELKTLADQSDSIKLKVFYNYLILQRKNYSLDYDDLIIFTLFIFYKHQDVLVKWQNRLQYIQVDEFQDVNKRQYTLVKMLSDIHHNLFIVGDPDQTIYSWRGANISFFLEFDRVFAGSMTIMMNTNYRSSPEILNTSNSLIEHNRNRIEKSLIAYRDKNKKTLHFHAKNTSEEADWIANKIKSITKESFSDIAILYRAHYVSRSIEESLLKHQIPYDILSGISFYQREEIKNVLSYLMLVASDNDLAFTRVVNTPNRGIGRKRLEIIKSYAKYHNISLYQSLKANLENSMIKNSDSQDFIQLIDGLRNDFSCSDSNLKIYNCIDAILKNSGYEKILMTEGDQERLDNIAELKDSVLQYENGYGEQVSIENYLSQLALYTNEDKVSKHEERVKLMTVHSSKGLEFPYVFVAGMNESIFPSAHIKNRADLEEERRLAYVAYTRAEKELYITEAEGFKHDTSSFRYPSRFIFNINKTFLTTEGSLKKEMIDEANHKITQSERILDNITISYALGDVVRHKIFGDGCIVGIDYKLNEYIIKFDNMSVKKNISFDYIGLIKR
jgi:DNA helicase-2/ATP-dependent DNA helicase PcrA